MSTEKKKRTREEIEDQIDELKDKIADYEEDLVELKEELDNVEYLEIVCRNPIVALKKISEILMDEES